MEESDSDAEPSRGRTTAAPGGDDDNKYPVDGMYVSQAEKAEIMAMREVEREQLIADRVSEIERQRQNRLLRQMVTSAENEERKQVKKKRSADTAELDDGQERSSRPRRGETAMDSLRRARAEKQRRREDQDRRRDAFSPGARGSPEAEESDDDYGRPRSRTPKEEAPRDAPPPELRDYERLRLGRNEFAQVCFTPGFEAAITGCYIRIALGPHPETGIEQYRMAVIKGKASVPRAESGMHILIDLVRLYHRPTVRAEWTQRHIRHRSIREGCARQGSQGVSFHRCIKWQVYRGKFGNVFQWYPRQLLMALGRAQPLSSYLQQRGGQTATKGCACG